jgi:phosphoglycerate dehydrogenase-like enzyme
VRIVTNTPIVLLHTANAGPSLERASAAHPDLNIHVCDSYEGLPQMLDRVQPEVVFTVRFAGTTGYPRAALLGSQTIKWISVGGSGTDHLAGWDPSHLAVTNAAGVAADMMAEYTLGAMLHFSLKRDGFAVAQAQRRWTPDKMTPIAGRTILILGLGKTGQAIARRCKAMGLTVLGVRARPKPTDCVDEVHGMDALPGLWPRADFIAVCVPLLDSTRRLVDASAIAAMSPDVVFIDVSRGGVVDQTALHAALQSGQIKGAALDVFETEPLPVDSPLWALENVILTPHCSAVYEGWDLNSITMFCENLTRYRAGGQLHNLVDPTRGY